MQRFLLFIALSIIIAVQTSCWHTHKRKAFSFYKHRPTIEGSATLKTDGIYCMHLTDSTSTFLYIFYIYKDGSFFTVNSGGRDIPTKREDVLSYINIISEREKRSQKSDIDFWGHYIIRHDTFFAQHFYPDYDVIPPTYFLASFQAIIKNDSTLFVYHDWSEDYKHKGEEIYKRPIRYDFYPTNFKPDSSKAWYRNKKWYIAEHQKQ